MSFDGPLPTQGKMTKDEERQARKVLQSASYQRHCLKALTADPQKRVRPEDPWRCLGCGQTFGDFSLAHVHATIQSGHQVYNVAHFPGGVPEPLRAPAKPLER